MTVEQLIEKLSKMPPKATVIVYTPTSEDASFCAGVMFDKVFDPSLSAERRPYVKSDWPDFYRGASSAHPNGVVIVGHGGYSD